MVKTGVFFLLLQIKNKIVSIYIIISEKMVIDFEKIAEAHLEGFKGGKGKLDTRNYVDDKVKIMYSTLRPGASTFIEDYIYNEKGIKENDNLLDKLYENALIKFNYLSVSDNEIKDFVDNELKNMKGND